MRLAIVGSQDRHWSAFDDSVDDARELIMAEIERVQPDIVVTGDADGVDSWARQIAEMLKIPIREYKSEGYSWEHFKLRNIKIAEDCDLLLCVRSKRTTTYGSGWTADYAEKLGVPVKRVVL